MKREQQTSSEPTYHVDGTDTEYISGLSTILAATIQETKESVSQIEYLFCKQLFPDFQSKMKKIYSEAKKAAEDEWKKRENNLIVQLQTLQSEKLKLLEENQFLKIENSKVKKIPNDLEEELKRKSKEIAEKRELQQSLRELLDSKASMVNINEKRMKELEEENNLLRERARIQNLEIEELKDLKSKNRISEEKDETNRELLELVRSKILLIEQKEQELKDKDDTMNELLTKLQSLEKNIDEKREFQETLLVKMRAQASENLKSRQLLDDRELENQVLTDQLRILEDNYKKQQKLIEQNESKGLELMKARRDLEELQSEKRSLLVKLKGFEEEFDKLQADIKEKSKEATEGMELHGKLLQQIEGKNNEIMIEKQKRREVIDAYKKLKSQYNYLCSKAGLTPENMHGSNSTNVSKDALDHDHSILNSPVVGRNSPISPSETTNHNINQQNPEDNKEIRLIQGSSSSGPLVAQPDSKQKTKILSGAKRPGSHWRDMRPTKNRNGPDPHDDFLDTPLENIKEELKKGSKEEEIHLPGPVPKDMNFESSDDETQDPGADPGLNKPNKTTFKYVEPVRKKADRANLKGVECKQCKKFYDAVLPDGDQNNNKQNLRCEHHEGVSRHRYRFVPPSTPEGFWNIGFESEM